MKDLFSDCSALYQQARPSYPQEVITEILQYVPSKQFAWDCGAGSGQFTQLLVPYFEQIVATDMSRQQLHQAPYFENVSYQVQPAEHTTFADRSFDLIVVAQALHWFNFDAFYAEVRRTLKEDGVIATVGYSTLSTSDSMLNALLEHLYSVTLADDWDPERKHVDAHYESIPFPFTLVAQHEFEMRFRWRASQVLGYLNTWSAVKKHRKAHGKDPLAQISAYLKDDDQQIEVSFPVFLKVGKLRPVKAKKSHQRSGSSINGLFKMRHLLWG